MAIARLEGDRAAVQAEMKAMDAGIETRLARMDARLAQIQADIANREVRMLLAVAGMLGLGIFILDLVLG